MKKITAVVALAFLAVTVLPSCKKDYTCECTYTVNGESVTTSHELGKQSKKDAKDACNKMESSTASIPGASVECKL